MSKIIDFYRCKISNDEGVFLKDILSWNDEKLEVAHDFIQWLFPLNEPSNFNQEAPILTKEDTIIFSHDSVLLKQVEDAFERMLGFFQMELKDGKVLPLVEVPIWLMAFNHNMLRATRIIKSLRLLGHEGYALAFYDALMLYKEKISGNTLKYWTDAMYGPLWITREAFVERISELIDWETIEPGGLEKWLSAPNPGFQGRIPDQMLDEGQGKELFEMIYRLESGAFS